MSLLHTAALSGAHEVAVALLSATTSLAGSAAATAEAAQRRDVQNRLGAQVQKDVERLHASSRKVQSQKARQTRLLSGARTKSPSSSR